MMKKSNGRILIKSLCFGSFTVISSLVLMGCQEGKNSNDPSNILPGPIITVEQSPANTGGSGVGTDHVDGSQTPTPLPTPIGAPTVNPGSPSGASPITGEDPVAPTIPTPLPIPTPPPATVVADPDILTFAAGTTISDAENITLTPTAAPIGGNLVLRLVSTDPGTAGFDAEGIPEITVTIPQGSSAARTVPVFRQLRAAFAGNGTIVISRDPATTAINFPANSVNEVVIIRALNGQEPPTQEPESVLAFTIDQITFTANNFALTQSDSTGIVGHGPLFGSDAPSNTFGIAEATNKFPDRLGCERALRGVRPFFVINEENGSGVFILDQSINPAARVRNPVTLAGQALNFRRNLRDNTLVADISPSNFDELFRINYFQSEQFDLNTAFCTTEFSDTTPPIPVTVLEFITETRIIPGVLRSTNRLFTLRGSNQGIDEPDSTTGNGRLFGPQIRSDRPLPEDMLELENPRFTGIQNVLDVSGNQLRTDITIVIDQIRNVPTQAAIQDQTLPNQSPSSNPVSGRLPNVSEDNSLGLSGQGSCPATADNNLICGRFQFNQPFRETTVPGSSDDLSDVLVIDGVFVGRITDQN
ncbi:MAG: hypothetical protein HC924_18115 [Synechococcaceae cyanobacterium SM2_3_2]|nr:hypothetical protein [Synechococcaceae cyanobacterium SM2_3_2]